MTVIVSVVSDFWLWASASGLVTGPHGDIGDLVAIEDLFVGLGPSVDAAAVREVVVVFVADVGTWAMHVCIGPATSIDGGVSVKTALSPKSGAGGWSGLGC